MFPYFQVRDCCSVVLVFWLHFLLIAWKQLKGCCSHCCLGHSFVMITIVIIFARRTPNSDFSLQLIKSMLRDIFYIQQVHSVYIGMRKNLSGIKALTNVFWKKLVLYLTILHQLASLTGILRIWCWMQGIYLDKASFSLPTKCFISCVFMDLPADDQDEWSNLGWYLKRPSQQAGRINE